MSFLVDKKQRINQRSNRIEDKERNRLWSHLQRRKMKATQQENNQNQNRQLLLLKLLDLEKETTENNKRKRNEETLTFACIVTVGRILLIRRMELVIQSIVSVLSDNMNFLI